jgi:hypothetical protein
MTNPVGDRDRPNLRDRAPLILSCIAAAYVALGAILWWASNAAEDGISGAIALATLVAQPMLIGVWTALGAGSILTRLPLAIPCTAFQVIVLAYIPRVRSTLQREEFYIYLVAGLAIWAAATIVFLIVRRFSGLRIQHVAPQPDIKPAGLQFSIRYLLTLTTLYAVALGSIIQVEFKPPPPLPFWGFMFGPDFLMTVVAVGGAIMFAALLPTMAVPLAILHGRPSRRPITWVIGLWIVITLSIIIFTIDQEENPLLTLGFLLLTQATAAAIGAGTALALRYAGLKLTRTSLPPPHPATTPISK